MNLQLQTWKYLRIFKLFLTECQVKLRKLRLRSRSPPADPDAIAAISEIGVLIIPLSQETNLLQAQFLNVIDDFSDEHLDLLLPLSEQITWLDLGRTSISDSRNGSCW